MGKITGRERIEELPEKVLLLYTAVAQLIEEGADVAELRVQEITERAGIGKGTAYDYFDSKEEIIVYAILFHMENMLQKLQQGIWEEKNFADRIRLSLERLDTQLMGEKCALRFVTMLFDTTQMGTLLRQALEEKKKEREMCEPLMAAETLVRRGIEDGELRGDMPVSYMTYSLLAKMVTYMVYLVSRGERETHGGKAVPGGKAAPGGEEDSIEKECTDEQFRRYVLEGILSELCAKSCK
ncbi:MAG: TetR/AcrR family transcriptional regulator [Lachnospiraceae bacterium]|nr:TetR/AcrR family transcriptional regulator [Lachnospiraceae bacterium]